MHTDQQLPSGILYVGDPHGSSKAPGRRIDDYQTSVLKKLEECAALTHSHNLLAVILGDLIHRRGENDVPFLCRIMAVLATFKYQPLCLEGNHGKEELRTTDADAEHLLDQAGAIRLMRLRGSERTSESLVEVEFEKSIGQRREHVLPEVVDFDTGHRAVLFPFPHGVKLPDQIPRMESDDDTRVVHIAITHHDLAFAGSHPGAVEIHEIAGADMLVNGHLHSTYPSVTVGSMRAHNPGNIEPVSVDCIDHVPCAWAWFPGGDLEIKPYQLTHVRDVFQLNGRVVEAASGAVAAADIVVKSQFAEVIAQARNVDAPVLATPESFVANLACEPAILAVSQPSRDILLALASQVD